MKAFLVIGTLLDIRRVNKKYNKMKKESKLKTARKHFKTQAQDQIDRMKQVGNAIGAKHEYELVFSYKHKQR